MNEFKKMTPSYLPPNRVRRTLVGGIALGYASLFIPKSFSADALPNASDASAPQVLSAFLSVSAFLSGHSQLDVQQANRLVRALVASDAHFPASIQDLAAFLQSRKPDPLQLQATLDAEKAPFAALPRQIATAWYVGVVGTGVDAQCITYASSLMNQAVSDHLRPPSYAYGAYGTWAVKPA